jgi:hypothetical protein
VDYKNPYLFAMLAEGGNRCELKHAENPDGSVVLTASRMKTRGKENGDPEYVLITAPRIQYCQRRRDVSFTLREVSELWFLADAPCVKYDFCDRNEDTERYELYYDEELVAYVKCESYRMFAPSKPEPSGEEYRLASIRFHENGRTYDYICEVADVQVGDTVIVEGYDGETEVTVTKVTTKRASELGLPVERYKKILRKA